MNLFSTLLRRVEARRTHAHLMSLEDYLLRDIGLTRNDLHDIVPGAGPVRTRTRRSHD